MKIDFIYCYSKTCIQRLSFLPFKGRVNLSKPENTFYLMEDYGSDHNNVASEPDRVFFCCLVSVKLL